MSDWFSNFPVRILKMTSKFEWILVGKGDVHKSQNSNFRSGIYVRSTVRLFDANNNFKTTIGPSMNQVRSNHGCGIFHSSVHSGRPVIVTAGGGSGLGVATTEIWDFTKPGSQWQLSKYFGLSNIQHSGLCTLIWYCAFINICLIFLPCFIIRAWVRNLKLRVPLVT